MCILLLYPVLGFAQTLYTWTDEKGVVHFSDKPPSDSQGTARPIPLPKLTNVSPRTQTRQQSGEPSQLTPQATEKVNQEPTTQPETADSQPPSEGAAVPEPPATRSQKIAESRLKKSEAILGRFSRGKEKKDSENQSDNSTASKNEKNISKEASKEIGASEPEEKKTFDWNDL